MLASVYLEQFISNESNPIEVAQNRVKKFISRTLADIEESKLKPKKFDSLHPQKIS